MNKTQNKPLTDNRLVARADEMAEQAHNGQKRRNGEPYILHPRRVAANFETDHILYCAALLHDVVEDTDLTFNDLYNEMTTVASDVETIAIIHIVRGLTRNKDEGESYLDFILRCAECIPCAKVKLADIEDNLSDLKPGSMRDKYELARQLLRERLGYVKSPKSKNMKVK